MLRWVNPPTHRIVASSLVRCFDWSRHEFVNSSRPSVDSADGLPFVWSCCRFVVFSTGRPPYPPQHPPVEDMAGRMVAVAARRELGVSHPMKVYESAGHVVVASCLRINYSHSCRGLFVSFGRYVVGLDGQRVVALLLRRLAWSWCHMALW